MAFICVQPINRHWIVEKVSMAIIISAPIKNHFWKCRRWWKRKRNKSTDRPVMRCNFQIFHKFILSQYKVLCNGKEKSQHTNGQSKYNTKLAIWQHGWKCLLLRIRECEKITESLHFERCVYLVFASSFPDIQSYCVLFVCERLPNLKKNNLRKTLYVLFLVNHSNNHESGCGFYSLSTE